MADFAPRLIPSLIYKFCHSTSLPHQRHFAWSQRTVELHKHWIWVSHCWVLVLVSF